MPKKTSKKDANKNIPVVYAYGVVNDAMASQVAQSLDFYSSISDCINVHVNSGGGSSGHGTAVRNCIKNCRVPVDVYIDGVAASMGAYMALSGRKVYMSKYARIMLHEGRMMEGGTAEELRDMADEVEACNNNLVAMVCERTGMSEDDVKARFFNGKDNWLSAREAVAMKLVDGIYDIDEVDVPEAANHIEVYAMMSEAYQNGVFKTEKNMETKYPKEVLASLGLKEGATEAEVTLATMELAKKNNTLALQVKAQRDESVKKDVTAQLDAVLEAKKITAEFKVVLAEQYAEKPEELKVMLAAMPAFQSVSDAVNKQNAQRPGAPGTYAPHVEALMKEGWDKLDKSGQLIALKRADPQAFTDLYKTKFGYEPNGKPTPAFAERDIANRK